MRDLRSATIDELLAAPEDELLANLDAIFYATDEQLTGRELEVAVNRARAWIDIWLSRNRRKLCTDNRVTQALRGDGGIEFGTVVDSVVTLGLGKPSAAIVAAILVKRGLDRICREHG